MGNAAKAKTLYDVLGISETASEDEVREAYYRRAKSAHPDKGGAQPQFDDVVRAAAILRDGRRRQLYDRGLIDELGKPTPAGLRQTGSARPTSTLAAAAVAVIVGFGIVGALFFMSWLGRQPTPPCCAAPPPTARAVEVASSRATDTSGGAPGPLAAAQTREPLPFGVPAKDSPRDGAPDLGYLPPGQTPSKPGRYGFAEQTADAEAAEAGRSIRPEPRGTNQPPRSFNSTVYRRETARSAACLACLTRATAACFDVCAR
jgi:curved DNA-binding protein CbpA